MSKIFETQDGSHSIFSESFGVSYHSKYGAIQESMHVFIESGLFHRIPGAKQLSVLEIGFGTGLNALLTLQEANKRQLPVYYEAVEAYPISVEAAMQLNYPEILEEAVAGAFLKMHEMEWAQTQPITPYFSFHKKLCRFEELHYQDTFDVIYFDAFAPNAQPELWEEKVLQIMYDALKENGVLTTYCAKGVVKRCLKGLGFTVESLKGPPGKREMTRAVKLPSVGSGAVALPNL
ncbi:MAG: tRNA (5-methylaminomethyl-2-thiouridine)(34)-methyltransferase MnmD [Lewinellaceae bacterium]|nr:tRNA (5-methylaminomethyl-2-thiouridine)(34)-methyltransferase MnmD [Phaeodactylibacter sp.]MCB0612006.1 tRNA (5-methylaminomethyl-2-thiouridine)(34)-methyltransferase MnmD [Phaeodactylibacter sp.]MCB9349419.1 tRNA (5-methylaminomethyl-2-thiouridine)(34)-methyltransferase MnmD [Lewinellaceae bacterium]